MAQSAEHVVVPLEVIRQPPSVQSDNSRGGALTFEEEAEQRMYGASWIQQASVLLKVPAVTMASGQTIFHRFYYRRSMFDFDVKLIAAASLYLGCKLEETPRRVRDMVNICVYMDWLDDRESRLNAALSPHGDKEQQFQSSSDAQLEISVEGEQPQLKEADTSTAPPPAASSTPPSTNVRVASPISQSLCSGGTWAPMKPEGDDSAASTAVEQDAATSSSKVSGVGYAANPPRQQYLDIAAMIEDLDSTLRFPDVHSREFRRLKTNIHRAERHILRETGFMISQTLVHPHRYILQYIHSLLGNNALVPWEWRAAVGQRAWGYLNDSLRTPLCCSFQPAAITSAAIFMAARDYGFILPKDSAWYLLFEVAWDDLVQVCKTILSVYTAPKPRYRKLAVPPIPPPVHPT